MFRYVTVPVITDSGSVFACSETRFAILSHQTRDIISINPKYFRHLDLGKFQVNDKVMFSYGKDGGHINLLAIYHREECPENLASLLDDKVEIKIPIITKVKKFESFVDTKDPATFYKSSKGAR